MESQEIHSSIYGQLVFDKGANTQWRKGRPFNKWSCENWITICKTMKLDPYFTPRTKINLKQIKELIMRCYSINSPRRKHREESSLILVLAMIFLHTTPKYQAIKAKVSKWDYTELKSFCTAKQSTNGKATKWMEENISKPYIG